MGRTIIVGDVHGCRGELVALLEAVGFATGDRLVFVGDLIARGPDPLGVLDIVRQTGAILVRGNHEEKLLAWHRARHDWIHGTGEAKAPLGRIHREVARALRPVDWKLLETSPLSFDLPEHGARVVHAGVVPGLPWEAQRPETLLHIRTIRRDGTPSESAKHALWGTVYVGPPHVVFGHNAAPRLQLHPWATGLDTACVYGGRLTALVLGPGQVVPKVLDARRRLLVSVPASRVHFDPDIRRAVA